VFEQLGVCRGAYGWEVLLSVWEMCGFLVIVAGDGRVGRVISPPSSCHCWIPSALFCVAGIRRVFDCVSAPLVFVSRTRFVAVSGAWGLNPVSGGWWPAPCYWCTPFSSCLAPVS